MKRVPLAFLVYCCLAVDPASPQNLSSPLPLDSAVIKRTMANGLTYYIRVNRKPEHRAELRLVVNAGSVLEEENQRGLAHLVEHMAFNGTKHFHKQALVNYLESVGMRFGPDLNAYTSFDETVYMLQIPTDSITIVGKAFDILSDWAEHVSFDDDEIDKERGVVIEEWRLGRGAVARMRDKQFPILFKDSRYAERLPIGSKKILETFDHNTLRKFYRDWYRPDLMAVIAVGDFDPLVIEHLIQQHFSGIPVRKEERPRTYYPVPDHAETLFAIATDPEASFTNLGVYQKLPVRPETTVADYRRSIIEGLYASMLSNRYDELARKASPPFLNAYAGTGSFVRTKRFFSIGASVHDNGIPRGLDAAMTEAFRVREFGFTATELEREKESLLRDLEQAFHERDKTESRRLAGEYIRNFLEAEPVPGIAYEYSLHQKLLSGITLDEVNALSAQLITDTNRVVLVSAPFTEGVSVPTAGELRGILDAVAAKTLTPYEDKTSAAPLVPDLPTPGSVASFTDIPSIGVTTWVLSNGMRVLLKPTTFKNDEIVFTGYSPGGTSLVPDREYLSASTAASIVAASGVGTFDRVTLEKKLAGKIVRVSPNIGEEEEGFSGSASPADLETMFQLIYLYFTAARVDSEAFLSFRQRMAGFLQNRSLRPESVFEDTVQATMTQHSFRRRPWSPAMLDEIDMQKAFSIFRQRFGDPADFTFVFVGSFTPEMIRPFITRYLASLPSGHRNETWKDVGIRPPDGVVTKTVHRGLEPKSQVRIVYTGSLPFDYPHRYALQSLASILRIRMRESLREEKGGTYGVSVSAATDNKPVPSYRFTISFGCAPERVSELADAAEQIIDSVRTFGASETDIAKVKETQRRERETDLEQNGFWLSTIRFYDSNGESLEQVLEFPQLVNSLSTDLIRTTASQYLNEERVARFILLPEHAAQP